MYQLIAALVVLALPATASAQSLELFELRTLLLDQKGHGYQSEAGPTLTPGTEQLVVVEPQIFARLRHSPAVTTDLAVEIDIVSAASPDAIDATTSASRYNEAVTLDVTHRWRHDKHGEIFGRWGLHVEEPLRSDFFGGGYTRRFADDNFTLTLSGLYSYDNFDKYGPYGDRNGNRNRTLGNGNVSMSQVLSPTTILDVAYGYTYQTGVLETTWNQVPTDDGKIAKEEAPQTRQRQAASVRLSQHLPRSHTTLKASYRRYHDTYDLDAHTVQLWAYQYLTRWLYGRVGWRVHTQDGAAFYGDIHPTPVTGNRTSDSDLAPFTSNEWTLKLALLGARAPYPSLGHSTLDATIGYYTRTNDLWMVWGSMSVGYEF